jgi:hypothetical protein
MVRGREVRGATGLVLRNGSHRHGRRRQQLVSARGGNLAQASPFGTQPQGFHELPRIRFRSLGCTIFDAKRPVQPQRRITTYITSQILRLNRQRASQ